MELGLRKLQVIRDQVVLAVPKVSAPFSSSPFPRSPVPLPRKKLVADEPALLMVLHGVMQSALIREVGGPALQHGETCLFRGLFSALLLLVDPML